jgi:hypothetical protein
VLAISEQALDTIVVTSITAGGVVLLGPIALALFCALWLLSVDRQAGWALLRELAPRLLEPFLVWPILLTLAGYATIAERLPLASVLRWPVVSVIAAAGLCGAVWAHRQQRISKLRTARYILYSLAFWTVYALPVEPTAAFGFSLPLLIAAQAMLAHAHD